MEPKSIFTELKRASLFDVLLVSFLLLPFVLLGWVKVFREIEVPVSITTLAIVTAIYAVGIAVMKIGTEKIRREDRRFQKLRQDVKNYLESYPSDKASFNRIRTGLNDDSISNDYLEELIRRFSTEFSRQSFTRGNPAIALVREIGEEPDEIKTERIRFDCSGTVPAPRAADEGSSRQDSKITGTIVVPEKKKKTSRATEVKPIPNIPIDEKSPDFSSMTMRPNSGNDSTKN